MFPHRTAPIRAVLSAVAFYGLATGFTAAQTRLPPPVAEEGISITFATENGWEYDGRVEIPPAAHRRNWAVMLLGGGLGTAIDWFAPGELTIDGKPTHDADAITRALLAEGFTVMRWHSIRRGDPLNAKDPLIMETPTPLQVVEQARLAFAAFLKTGVVPEDHIFLLGHSLGAYRACVLVQEHPKVAGVVTLAGASLIPSDLETVRRMVHEAATDPRVARMRFENVHEMRAYSLKQSRDRWGKEDVKGKDRWGHRWPAGVVVENKTPTLLLVGSLDERWLLESYVFTAYLREHEHPDYAWKVFEQLGHNLGAEVPGAVTYRDQGDVADSRSGPMDPTVIKTVVDWLVKRAP